MTKKAKMFVKEYLPPGAFIGIHLRNGVDWVKFSSLKINTQKISSFLDLCFAMKFGKWRFTKILLIRQVCGRRVEFLNLEDFSL